MNFYSSSKSRFSRVISTFIIFLFFSVIIWNIAVYLIIEEDGSNLQVLPLDNPLPTNPIIEDSPSKNRNKKNKNENENENENDIIKDISINQKYCGSNKCKFLFAHTLPEQESQANSHFYSLTQLAEMLNRTMVLVNVQNSRIGTCKKLPFNFYYDVKELKKLFPNVNFITQNDFLNWTKELHKKPNAIFRSISEFDPPNTISSYSMVSTERDLKDLLSMTCLDEFDLKFNLKKSIYREIFIGPHKYWWNPSNISSMKNFLVKHLRKVNDEVILIEHDLRKPLFQLINPPLPYANHLVEIANSVTKKLRPYIAIHWRQEMAPPRLMPKCAIDLVDYIKKLELETGVKNIYFATDYPLYNGGERAQSDTFEELEQEHHDSIKILRNSTLTFNSWVSLKALNVLYKRFPQFKHSIEEEFQSSGIQGIFDKLVLIHSDYFVSGPHGCARILSNFTKKIFLARRLLMETDENIHNDIYHWTTTAK